MFKPRKYGGHYRRQNRIVQAKGKSEYEGRPQESSARESIVSVCSGYPGFRFQKQVRSGSCRTKYRTNTDVGYNKKKAAQTLGGGGCSVQNKLSRYSISVLNGMECKREKQCVLRDRMGKV